MVIAANMAFAQVKVVKNIKAPKVPKQKIVEKEIIINEVPGKNVYGEDRLSKIEDWISSGMTKDKHGKDVFRANPKFEKNESKR